MRRTTTRLAGCSTLIFRRTPGDARALFDRGYCDDAQGKTQAAESYYRKAIVADPKQFEARLALGIAAGAGGRIRGGADANRDGR